MNNCLIRLYRYFFPLKFTETEIKDFRDRVDEELDKSLSDLAIELLSYQQKYMDKLNKYRKS